MKYKRLLVSSAFLLGLCSISSVFSPRNAQAYDISNTEKNSPDDVADQPDSEDEKDSAEKTTSTDAKDQTEETSSSDSSQTDTSSNSDQGNSSQNDSDSLSDGDSQPNDNVPNDQESQSEGTDKSDPEPDNQQNADDQTDATAVDSDDSNKESNQDTTSQSTFDTKSDSQKLTKNDNRSQDPEPSYRYSVDDSQVKPENNNVIYKFVDQVNDHPALSRFIDRTNDFFESASTGILQGTANVEEYFTKGSSKIPILGGYFEKIFGWIHPDRWFDAVAEKVDDFFSWLRR